MTTHSTEQQQKKGIEPFQKVSPEATLKSEKKKREREGGTNRNRNAQKRRE